MHSQGKNVTHFPPFHPQKQTNQPPLSAGAFHLLNKNERKREKNHTVVVYGVFLSGIHLSCKALFCLRHVLCHSFAPLMLYAAAMGKSVYSFVWGEKS